MPVPPASLKLKTAAITAIFSMILTRLSAANWRNFQHIDVPLEQRIFAVGPNAGGKSNFLDLFRFLNDLVLPGGGLYRAIDERGGLFSLVSRLSPKDAPLSLAVDLGENNGAGPAWRYEIGIRKKSADDFRPVLAWERIWRNGEQILDRPNDDDRRDPPRLEETFLENAATNEPFREIAKIFCGISYTNLLPQTAYREPRRGPSFSRPQADESTRVFLEEVFAAPPEIRAARLEKIEAALCLVVPQLEKMTFCGIRENRVGLETIFQDWRSGTAQPQQYFSDGTIRLISILWALLETGAIPLLEEPELSLHPAVVRQLPGLIYRLKRHNPGQVIVTTHSAEMLSDPGIDGREVLLFLPDGDGGATVVPAADLTEMKALIDQGMCIGDIALPRSQPPRINELGFFE